MSRRRSPLGRLLGLIALMALIAPIALMPATTSMARDGAPSEAATREAAAGGAAAGRVAAGAAATGAAAAGVVTAGESVPDDAALWRDGDGDGLIDAAEDLDRDGLGGLGEQRYGTLPLDPDSDGDGISDGDEDTDGDGRSDAQQQDQRRLPGNLRPTTEMAYWDRPSNYVDRCHNDAVDAEVHPCSLAAAGSAVRVVLFGDSHALQWLPALAEASLGMGWEVVALTKAACPPAHVEFARKEVGAGLSCVLWRDRALAWLAAEQPSLVILSGAGRAYKLVDGVGQRIPDDEAAAGWRRGLTTTLEALPDATTAVVLADTPLMRRNPVTCLEADPGDVSACLTPRSAAIDPVLDAVEREAAAASGAAFESLNELVCPYSPCPAIVGDVLMWRNADHITATFARQLAPSMRELVRRNLPAGAGGVAPEERGVEAAAAEDVGGGG